MSTLYYNELYIPLDERAVYKLTLIQQNAKSWQQPISNYSFILHTIIQIHTTQCTIIRINYDLYMMYHNTDQIRLLVIMYRNFTDKNRLYRNTDKLSYAHSHRRFYVP
jgi:methionyl-tRNA synthetase